MDPPIRKTLLTDAHSERNFEAARHGLGELKEPLGLRLCKVAMCEQFRQANEFGASPRGLLDEGCGLVKIFRDVLRDFSLNETNLEHGKRSSTYFTHRAPVRGNLKS